MELAVVTGASSGIGAAVARALHAAGRPVLLLARRAERLEALGLAGASSAAVDVTDEAAVARAIERAETAHGPVGVLVNCAGVLHLGPFLAQSTAVWRETLEVNVLGTVIPIRAVLPGMVARGAGTIVNISSIAGRHGFPDHGAYCASKFALEGLSASLRKEVGRYGVRVIVIAPGVVDTPLGRGTADAESAARKEAFSRSIDGGLQADTVAAVVCQAIDAPPEAAWQEVVVTHVGES